MRIAAGGVIGLTPIGLSLSNIKRWGISRLFASSHGNSTIDATTWHHSENEIEDHTAIILTGSDCARAIDNIDSEQILSKGFDAFFIQLGGKSTNVSAYSLINLLTLSIVNTKYLYISISFFRQIFGSLLLIKTIIKHKTQPEEHMSGTNSLKQKSKAPTTPLPSKRAMTAERIFPNFRKLYKYTRGNFHISVRIITPEGPRPLQFMHFDTAEEAEQYFIENYL